MTTTSGRLAHEHEQRLARLERAIDALSPAGAEFFERWRRCVELSGRASARQHRLDVLAEFAESIGELSR